MKIFKKNQVIIYIIALMLVTAGYLNFRKGMCLHARHRSVLMRLQRIFT